MTPVIVISQDGINTEMPIKELQKVLERVYNDAYKDGYNAAKANSPSITNWPPDTITYPSYPLYDIQPTMPKNPIEITCKTKGE